MHLRIVHNGEFFVQIIIALLCIKETNGTFTYVLDQFTDDGIVEVVYVFPGNALACVQIIINALSRYYLL